MTNLYIYLLLSWYSIYIERCSRCGSTLRNITQVVQSAKILLLPPKCEIIFVTLQKKYFFQYCDINFGLFSVIHHLVITLPTLRQQKLSLLISLLLFLYEFCRLVRGFFSVLLPIQLSLFQLLRQQQLSLFYALIGVSEK